MPGAEIYYFCVTNQIGENVTFQITYSSIKMVDSCSVEICSSISVCVLCCVCLFDIEDKKCLFVKLSKQLLLIIKRNTKHWKKSSIDITGGMIGTFDFL